MDLEYGTEKKYLLNELYLLISFLHIEDSLLTNLL